MATLDGGGKSVVIGDRAGGVYAFHLSERLGRARLARPPRCADRLDALGQPRRLGHRLHLRGYRQRFPTLRRRLRRHHQHRASRSGRARPADPNGNHGVQASLAVGTMQGVQSVVAPSLGPERLCLERRQRRRAPRLAVLHGRQRLLHAVAGRPVRQRRHRDRRGWRLDVRQRLQRPVLQRRPHPGARHRRQPDLLARHRTRRSTRRRPSGTSSAGVPWASPSGPAPSTRAPRTPTSCSPPTPTATWSGGSTSAGSTQSSPAIGDVLGNSTDQVIEGVDTGSGGLVWALNGSSGAALPGWPVATPGRIIGERHHRRPHRWRLQRRPRPDHPGPGDHRRQVGPDRGHPRQRQPWPCRTRPW